MKVIEVGYGISAIALSVALTFARPSSNPPDLKQQHFEKVRSSLPPYSALPPLLDLSRSDASPLKEASHEWEDRFSGIMGVRPITDPGVSYPSGASSISTTATEYGTPVWALPVRSCDAVIVGEPTSSAAHLAYNHRFVYSTFFLKPTQTLKGKKTSTKTLR